MSRLRMFCVSAAALGAAFLVHWRLNSIPEPQGMKTIVAGEGVPVTPWRNPDQDMSNLYPGANAYTVETRALSGMLAQIQKVLGRKLSSDENPLRIYRVRATNEAVGSVLVSRVKGEHGGIELVTGFDRQGSVTGVIVQSQREPLGVISAITNRSWLGAFTGKSAKSSFQLGDGLPSVPSPAEFSAQAVAQGVRASTILLSFAERSLEQRDSGTGAHH